jgi:hypothetical protein
MPALVVLKHCGPDCMRVQRLTQLRVEGKPGLLERALELGRPGEVGWRAVAAIRCHPQAGCHNLVHWLPPRCSKSGRNAPARGCRGAASPARWRRGRAWAGLAAAAGCGGAAPPPLTARSRHGTASWRPPAPSRGPKSLRRRRPRWAQRPSKGSCSKAGHECAGLGGILP